ncbi:MAG: hypothetical protein HOV68_19515 [Streptomycetaceae bacterium]|nr:hypothetical protein [Streptomycetaceae bacterium]
MQMTVQVTFVGGPADGKVDHLPLSRLKEKITISGVVYQSSPGYPPEIIDTPQGKAEVFRPVQG